MQYKKRKRLLVTGGSGFVGGHIMARALGEWDVFGTYRKRIFNLEGAAPVELNMARTGDIRKVVTEISPDVIIHTAACSDLDACDQDREMAFRINAETAGILSHLCRDINARIIFTSSDMVYDGEKGDYAETDGTNPITVYGESKLSGERLVTENTENFVIARLALVYGPPVTGSNSFSEKILSCVSKGDRMPLFTDQYRSPVLVSNLAEALLELAVCDYVGTINLGGCEKTDRYTFGRCLADIKRFSKSLLNPVSMSDVSFGVPRPRDVSLNISKAKETLRTGMIGFSDGLYRAYHSTKKIIDNHI